jgi:hypothetical protein
MGLTTVHPGGEESVDVSASIAVGCGDDISAVAGTCVGSASVAVGALSTDGGSSVIAGVAPWQAANSNVINIVMKKTRFVIFAP